MTIRGKAFIVGSYEHPDRVIPGQVRLADPRRGLHRRAQGRRPEPVRRRRPLLHRPAEHGRHRPLRLPRPQQPQVLDTTMTGGSSPVFHIGHAAIAIATGRARSRWSRWPPGPRSERQPRGAPNPEASFEQVFGTNTIAMYALAAQRHMYEFGTTSEQLAWVKVAASQHAQHNPHALLQKVVTVEEVVNSRMLSDPLHLLDTCVVTDSGGAIVMASPEVAKSLGRTRVKILGHGEAPKHTNNGKIDLTYTGARWSGPARLRGGRRHARRRRLRLDLRLVHHHRGRDASKTSASARRARAARSSPTAACSSRAASCPSTPTAAASATTTRAWAAC